jgi:hypothetical protein
MSVVMNGLLKNMIKIIHLYIVQNVNLQHGIDEAIFQVQWLVARWWTERRRGRLRRTNQTILIIPNITNLMALQDLSQSLEFQPNYQSINK